jgi:hypothetical protein
MLMDAATKASADHSGRPRGQRHEVSSPAYTPGSLVRIPLEAWMFVCVCSVCALLCSLRRAGPPSEESYRLCKEIKKLKKRPRSNKGLYSQIDRQTDRQVGK